MEDSTLWLTAEAFYWIQSCGSQHPSNCNMGYVLSSTEPTARMFAAVVPTLNLIRCAVYLCHTPCHCMHMHCCHSLVTECNSHALPWAALAGMLRWRLCKGSNRLFVLQFLTAGIDQSCCSGNVRFVLFPSPFVQV